MTLITYIQNESEPADFVDFWAAQYSYADEHLYGDNIGQEMTEDRILELFKWKNGSNLSARKRDSVMRNYVENIERVNGFSEKIDPRCFLEQEFPDGGAIWRIFWLHCCRPDEFPIYDQHVHRAMVFIQTREIEEITSWPDPMKVSAYLDQYLRFHNQTFKGLDQRRADKALWAYGRFVKNFPRFGQALAEAHH